MEHEQTQRGSAYPPSSGLFHPSHPSLIHREGRRTIPRKGAKWSGRNPEIDTAYRTAGPTVCSAAAALHYAPIINRGRVQSVLTMDRGQGGREIDEGEAAKPPCRGRYPSVRLRSEGEGRRPWRIETAPASDWRRGRRTLEMKEEDNSIMEREGAGTTVSSSSCQDYARMKVALHQASVYQSAKFMAGGLLLSHYPPYAFLLAYQCNDNQKLWWLLLI